MVVIVLLALIRLEILGAVVLVVVRVVAVEPGLGEVRGRAAFEAAPLEAPTGEPASGETATGSAAREGNSPAVPGPKAAVAQAAEGRAPLVVRHGEGAIRE